MDQLPLFVEASNVAITVARDRAGTWHLVVASHTAGAPWDDSQRSRYECLSGEELVDVLLAELFTRCGLT